MSARSRSIGAGVTRSRLAAAIPSCRSRRNPPVMMKSTPVAPRTIPAQVIGLRTRPAAQSPMAVAVRTLLGEGGDGAGGGVLMVGDRASTDGAFAVTLGCPFALVRTGVTLPGDQVGVPVAIDGADLAAVVDTILAAHRTG